MSEWWQSLDALARWFYGAAVFFSVFFLWQFISAVVGLGADELEVDAEVDADVDLDDIESASAGDAVESVSAFRLLTIRSILAFLTMFFWAGALYRNFGQEPIWAIIYGLFWGLGGFVAVAMVVNMMRRLTETGTAKLSTCVGTRGVVYLDIPADGQGEARVNVSGTVAYVKARGAGGQQVTSGTPVRVVRTLDSNTVEVEPIAAEESGKGETK